MKNYRKVAVSMLLMLMLNVFTTILAPVAAAYNDHSHVNTDHDHEISEEMSQSLLPENLIVWETKEFLAWVEASAYKHLARQVSEVENTAIGVFKLADFDKWVASLAPEVAAIAKSSAIIVQGSQMPDTISLNIEGDMAISTQSISDTEEYVIIPMSYSFCATCNEWLWMFFGWVMGKFVFDPAYNALKIWWNKVHSCPNGHIVHQETYVSIEPCRYAPHCLGTWARVIADYGTYVECECECGGLWTAYCPG